MDPASRVCQDFAGWQRRQMLPINADRRQLTSFGSVPAICQGIRAWGTPAKFDLVTRSKVTSMRVVSE
jgi:hypothetical protein